MKVFIQIVDVKFGIYQTGMIDEPVEKGFEIKNALRHFGSDDVDWITDVSSNEFTFKLGKIRETTKIVSVLLLNNLNIKVFIQKKMFVLG